MSDIVERLREMARWHRQAGHYDDSDRLLDAVDEIERLRQIEREAQAVSDYLTGSPDVPDELVDYAKEQQERIERLRQRVGPEIRYCRECWSLDGWDEQAGFCYDCDSKAPPVNGRICPEASDE